MNNAHRLICLFAIMALLPSLIHARAIVVKRALNQMTQGKQLLANGDLERLQDGLIAEVKPWDSGYEVEANARSGKVAAKVSIPAATEEQHGLTYPVNLNQQVALPFTAELWSKAAGVSGTPDSNYSLYLDLEYMDGSTLWGQIAPFATGTHDWQQRTVTVVPEKPVKVVSFHAIFRAHTGTVWFDDFALYALDLPEGAGMFDGVPVMKETSQVVPVSSTGEVITIQGAMPLRVDAKTGLWLSDGRNGGLFLRDARRKSDFRQPVGEVTKDGKFEATDEELGLKITAYLQSYAWGDIRIEGVIEDLTGEDRGVSVYCSLPMQADTWHQDMRTSQPIVDGQAYSNSMPVGCGANGRMSLYPFGCVTNNGTAMVLGAPLDPPRLYRFGYDAASRELYGVEDLGLTKDSKTPQKASFSFVLYPRYPNRGSGFRGALAGYYEMFAKHFTKRTQVEGNWMAFDDIAPVQNAEDFHFAFKEGTNNPAYDEAHGILTYTYVEPMSYWMALGELPRTPEAAMELLDKQAKQNMASASATMTSAVRHADNSLDMQVVKAPWCDGALFLNNPDPDIPTTEQYPVNQGMLLWRSIESGLGQSDAMAGIAGWRGWEGGYVPAAGEGRDGSQAALITRPEIGTGHGMAQAVPITQTKPGKVTITAWARTENVTGAQEDKDFSIYADLRLADGTPSWGHSAPFSLGTHDWEQKTVTIELTQPIVSMSLHLLFRGDHTGKAWFDDVAVVEEGSDRNLAQNGEMEQAEVKEAFVDGTYIDSLEMGAGLLDFDRNHWKAADAPLVFTTDEGLPAELLMFATCDFIRDVSEKMHAQGRTIFANAALHRFAQPAAVLDVMGTETNWRWGGNWNPMTDADCNFKRAMSYQRPYLLLQNTEFQNFPVDMVEKYMKRSVFYGLFPSFFSHNAADATYWTRPEIYNRDRHLFKKYLPVVKRTSAAGWEPLTHATTGNPKVYIERWGRGNEIYFTLFNDSDALQEYRLAVDAKGLGIGEVKGLEVLIGEGTQVAADVRETLAAEDLRVFKIVQ